MIVTAVDPLRACPDGRYEDERVVAEPGGRRGVHVRALPDGRVHVLHHIDTLDDDLAEALAVALSPVTDDHGVFVRAFTGVVLTSCRDPLEGWEHFYRNSLARRSGYQEIYRHALDLLPHASVLDLGCGFGLLALQLAERGAEVIAHDVDASALGLLRTMSARLGIAVTICEDATALPCADAVALLHVLEHLDYAAAATVLDQAMRLARHAVVVAVPFESVPNPLYGHLRRYGLQDLVTLGTRPGWTTDVHEHDGGWLVLQRTTQPRGGPVS